MSQLLRVLVVEDNVDDAELVLSELRRAGYETSWTRVETERDFLYEILRLPDIILSDYSMPQFNGLRAAELLNQSGLKIPFILISGTVGEDVAVAAMRQGATDYLLKDRMGRLGTAVERALREATAHRERELVDKKLAESQLQLQKTLEHSPVVLYSLTMFGPQIVPRMVSENVSHLLGYSVDECLEVGWWEKQLHPDDVEAQRAIISRNTNANSLTCEYRIRHKRGTYLWIEDRRRILRNGRGVPVEISGVWIDISARKRSELQLDLLHRSHSLILNSVSEGIQGIDCSGNITFENLAAATMLGWEGDDLVGANAHDVMHHSHADGSPLPLAECRIQATLNDGVPRRVDDEVFWRKDGSSFPVEYVVASQLDEHGAITGAVVVFHDIAERRNLESQLRQSQKLESVGLLAGGIAHDFNNILGAIIMQADHASLPTSSPPVIREALSEIRLAADRAANLTRQLLLFSRKQVMQPQALELNTAVSSLVKMLQRIVPEDVHVQLILQPTPLSTIADAGMLDQVLMNLAVNARDAMPDGGKMTITTSERTITAAEAVGNPELTPGRFVGFSVQDTGIGIPLDVRGRIFEPFFTTKEAGKGTGLGMATVFGIVKQHHGWLDLQSEVGRGTTVSVFFPAKEFSPPAAGTPRHVSAVAAHGTELILLAEDDRSVRVLIRRVLEMNGYSVLEATSGVDALRVWSEGSQNIALLLTDLVMPGGTSGQKLASTLRAANPSLKVLFTSGYSAEIAGRELHLDEGESFVQKPFSSQALLAAVRSALDT